MDAQARMRNSKILVSNVGALANETIKNLVLAGIGSLTIVDDHKVTEEDFGAQFFVQEGDEGKNRAEAALPRIQALNKHVTIATKDASVLSLDKEFIDQFDIVVATQPSIADILHVTELCQQTSTAYMVAGISGLQSFAFSDLGDYTYTFTNLNKPNESTVPKGSSLVGFEELKDGDKVSYKVKVNTQFKPFKEALETASFAKEKARVKLRVPPYLAALIAGWDYETANPGKLWSELSTEEYYKLCVEACSKLQLPPGVVSEEFAAATITSKDAELATVASVVGGVIAQEVLNYMARTQHPLDNFLVFDAATASSPIYKF